MIFSFYPTKPVGSIDGGMIVSNDKEKIDRFKILSRYGMSQSDNSWERKIILPGWKMYMNSIQCFIAQKNLFRLEQKHKRFDEIREFYNSKFGLNRTSRHLYRVNVNDNELFIEDMKSKRIQCGIHYKALHLNHVYNKNYISLPRSEYEHKTTVSIPFHEKLSDEEIEHVVQEIKPYVITPQTR